MLDCAALIGVQPESLERTKAAERLVRTAMHKFALRQITEGERRQILDCLRPCCPELFAASAPPKQREAALQTLDDEPTLADAPDNVPEY
jgi:hypothetical protein